MNLKWLKIDNYFCTIGYNLFIFNLGRITFKIDGGY